MKRHGALALAVLSCFFTAGARGAAAPAAPTPLGPSNGASITTPFTISWSAVSDPAGINGYNWQLGTSPSFTTLVKADSTAATEDIISGVPIGATYFWRVQAVNGAGEASPWSAPRSVTVTGTGAGTPGTPVANPTTGYSTLHPWEFVQFTWSAVPDAAEYFHIVSNDPSFPIGTSPAEGGAITFWTDNITSTSTGFVHAIGEGTWYARVYAVSADEVFSLPSNTISYTVFFNNPVPPPPTLISPVGNPTIRLPFSLKWNHVSNPQAMGYEVQVSTNASFSNNETPLGVQLTNPEFVIKTLTAGQKFWRVRSHHGLRSQDPDGSTTNAVTNWSATGTFTMTTAPATVVSTTPVRNPLYSGEDTFVEVQLTVGAPSGGATVQLSSSHPALAPVPATLAFPATWGLNSFQMVAGQVTTPTVVTLRGTLNGVQTPTQFTLRPPELKSIEVSGGPSVTGGIGLGAIVSLHGRAPAGGATVAFASSSPAVDPPPSVTIAAGDCCAPVSMDTTAVTSDTPVTITATWNGVSQQALVSVKPPPTPSGITLFPTTVVGGESSVQGVINVTTTAPYDRYMQVTSNNAAVLGTVAVVPAFDNRGLFMLLPNPVSQSTVATIATSGGGVTRSTTLTINPSGSPPPGPTLSSFTVSPTSVSGGTSASGTIRLPSPAPAGGAAVTLTSNQPGAASVPSSVTVPSGSTQAGFTITTFPNAGTTVQLSAQRGDTILFSSIFVGPGASAPALSSVSLSPSSVTGGASSTGTVTLSAAAPSGGTVVSLSDNSASATTPSTVTVAAGSTSRTFTVTTSSVGAATTATITATLAGTARTATLTVNPSLPAAPTLVAPANGASVSQPVTLDWNDVAGAASYEVQVDTSSSISSPFAANPTVTVSQATLSGLPSQQLWWRVRARNAAGTAGNWSSVRSFTPQASAPPPGQTVTVTLTVSGRSGERLTSSPAGLNVPVGSSGSAPFAPGTSITLTVSDGRDAIFSGACSSGGTKRKTCTFTPTANASVTANVQ